MSTITLILLYLLSLFNGERTISGIYHLLKGKRSSQTIQDGHLYQCLFLFGILPRLTREDLDQKLAELLINHYIKQESDLTYKITKKGEEFLNRDFKEISYIFYLNGWKHKGVASLFWSRLVLTIQSLSSLEAKAHHFFPVIKDEQVKGWVKKHFPKQVNRKQFSSRLYKELMLLLCKLSKEEAEICTYKLSGSHRIGLTNEQLALMYEKDKEAIFLIHLSIVHRMLDEMELKSDQFPLLNTFISDMNRSLQMTNSTRQTYFLMKRGLSLEEIAIQRNLKVNTIEDHIVEIMLEDKSLELTSFIEAEEVELISEVIANSTNKKLSHLKMQLPPDISFFKIRLVLARLGEQ
ncbi:helix-turn-helix domain-containing protein [Alkalihalobacterium chitinilyticum]|uniref:Helix-turn-helix domain-containing protein n=1 Tax=Alkalihalobacterium chitinilyticum TaxID=2980103 RepID=A0ABT5V936_9BACI|nr:helix-turn-helix domain-containing protein [Alkalihalobacterium chitinilyticum]MDE5411978.1 helix-turn-helix domain-containing protein [Alkalihalobacterium chitinilyticum]